MRNVSGEFLFYNGQDCARVVLKEATVTEFEDFWFVKRQDSL
jgi:hypothetical protein